MTNRNDSFILLTGLLIGAAAGATAGILLAPSSGRDARKRICEGSENLKSRIKNQLENICSSASCSSEMVEVPAQSASKSTKSGSKSTKVKKRTQKKSGA